MSTMDMAARQQITLLRRRIEELEGRAPVALPPAERFGGLLTAVAAEFGVLREEILGESRSAHLVLPRQVAMALAQRLLGYSLPRIGRLLNRDHSTVHHGIRRVARQCAHDPGFAQRLDALAARITSRRTAT